MLEKMVNHNLIVDYKTEIYFLGEFCYELLETYAVWTPRTSLIQVIKAVINAIDYPNVDYSISERLYFSFLLSCLLNCFVLYLELGREYQYYREDFNRKALEYVRRYGLPRW